MAVIGGRDSSNTHRLVDVSRRHCPTFHVETVAELKAKWFDNVKRLELGC